MEPHVAKDRRGCTVLPVDKLHIAVLCVDLEFFETIAFCPLTRKVDNKYFLLLLFPIFLLWLATFVLWSCIAAVGPSQHVLEKLELWPVNVQTESNRHAHVGSKKRTVELYQQFFLCLEWTCWVVWYWTVIASLYVPLLFWGSPNTWRKLLDWPHGYKLCMIIVGMCMLVGRSLFCTIFYEPAYKLASRIATLRLAPPFNGSSPCHAVVVRHILERSTWTWVLAANAVWCQLW